MAQFNKAYKQLQDDEFSSIPERFLHKNKGEKGFTLGGIYEVANPNKIDWGFVKSLHLMCGHDIERTSKMLFYDDVIQSQVYGIFERYYWDKIRLSEIHSQRIASELFDRAVLSGRVVAVKIAQRVIDVKVDGILGEKTLKALNCYNEDLFDRQYDDFEEEFIEEVIKSKAKHGINLERYRVGWRGRARRT